MSIKLGDYIKRKGGRGCLGVIEQKIPHRRMIEYFDIRAKVTKKAGAWEIEKCTKKERLAAKRQFLETKMQDI